MPKNGIAIYKLEHIEKVEKNLITFYFQLAINDLLINKHIPLIYLIFMD